MKSTLAFAAAALAAFSAAAGVPAHENPAVNSRNRLSAAAYMMPLASEKDALSDALEPPTPWKMSLNGDWSFKWTGDPARRPRGFWKEDFDGSKWEKIDVPSCVETRGYGIPHYRAHGYPHKFAWPKILDADTGRADYNPVLSYRRDFELPKGWEGRETILRFDGVYSAYTVWINGRQVGYAEDSKLPSEFDATPFLRKGRNTIAVEVFRWCDGSYVEDQDMLRFSGIFRDVTLWSRPRSGVADVVATTQFGEGYASATVFADVSLRGTPGEASVALYDGGKALVAEARGDATRPFALRVAKARPWSAEDPYLYTLVVKAGGDVRSLRIGLKEQKVEKGVFKVNGRAVKLHGVNRHEHSAENGRTVSLAEMVSDVETMKRCNIDTVRTSHYPNHRLWYDLCDRYGIYLIAEANVEAHGAGYKKDGFGPIKAWDHTIVERNERQVLFYRNHASVMLWSMGNETLHGDCFRHAIAAVKRIDPTRPVHWECGNADADVDSKMYPRVKWTEEQGATRDANGGKPLLLCEYAHAMGNALGNLQEYWDAIYAHPTLMGGCIWDWIDQGLWRGTGRADPATGREERFLAYGGDWYETKHDGLYCINGLVDPLRNSTPKLVETAHVYRPFAVEFTRDGSFILHNRYSFTDANRFAGTWTLLADGAKVASGEAYIPSVKPLSSGAIALDAVHEAIARGGTDRECFIDVEFRTQEDCIWAKAGHVVAREQIAVAAPPAAKRAPKAAEGKFDSVAKKDGTLTVSRGGTVAAFDLKSGAIIRLVLPNGAVAFHSPAPGIPGGPQLTCVRALVDNDKWLKQTFMDSGLATLRYHPEPVAAEGCTVKMVVDVQGAKGCGFLHRCDYVFLADGTVEIRSRVEPYGKMPPALPRLGLTMRLPPALENARWYGRGPGENYADRCTASFYGVYSSAVSALAVDYVRPQDNGYRGGVRWAEFTDAEGRGARFSADVPLFMQALHCGWEDLQGARHLGPNLPRHRAPVAARPETLLNLDVRQSGLGGSSVGPAPLDKYRFDPAAPVEWTLSVSPAGKGG